MTKNLFNPSPLILFIIQGSCTLGAQITLEWMNKPYNICITTQELRQTTAFKSINPLGKVGALKDGELVIYENSAILLHLSDRYDNKKQYCPDISHAKRYLVYQWLSYLSSTLHVNFSQFNYPVRFVENDYISKFQQLALNRLHQCLEYINNSFNHDNLLISDSPTIVEAQAYALLRWCKRQLNGENLVSLDKYPKISKFLLFMENITAVQNALLIESGNGVFSQEILHHSNSNNNLATNGNNHYDTSTAFCGYSIIN